MLPLEKQETVCEECRERVGVHPHIRVLAGDGRVCTGVRVLVGSESLR